MKYRPTQFGVRENTASSRQHALRLSASPSSHQSCVISLSKPRDKRSAQRMSPSRGTFSLSLSEARKRVTGQEKRDTGNPAIVAHEHGRQSAIAPTLRTQFRAVSKAQFDLKSTAGARDRGICVMSTHEPNQERGGLP